MNESSTTDGRWLSLMTTGDDDDEDVDNDEDADNGEDDDNEEDDNKR